MRTKGNTQPTTVPENPRSIGNRRLIWIVATLAFALYAIINIGGKARLVTRRYEIYDERIRDEMRIAVVSDLHDSLYGKNQSRIVDALAEVRPDAVLILGDLFHQSGSHANAQKLLDALTDTFDCYYIYGNHEYQSGEIALVRSILEQSKITILERIRASQSR
ncbi:MAG: metallophosphoesterase [Eubacteriales bacterium]